MTAIENISIGVENYSFISKKTCKTCKDKKVKLSLSFNLKGNFLLAAKSDLLIQTVDYESLCSTLKAILETEDGTSIYDLSEKIKAAILNFSPLIAGGTFCIRLDCHKTFTENMQLI